MSHCVIEEVFDHSAFDKALGDILSKHEGETSKFLFTVFDYLRRKTNFYKEGDSQKRILEAYKQVCHATTLLLHTMRLCLLYCFYCDRGSDLLCVRLRQIIWHM